MKKLKLKYTFEKMSTGSYQVRLNGEFICYSNHTNENYIDDYLKEMGYTSREDFLDYCYEEAEEQF